MYGFGKFLHVKVPVGMSVLTYQSMIFDILEGEILSVKLYNSLQDI